LKQLKDVPKNRFKITSMGDKKCEQNLQNEDKLITVNGDYTI